MSINFNEHVLGVGPQGQLPPHVFEQLDLPDANERAAMQAVLDDYQAGQDATDTAVASALTTGPQTQVALSPLTDAGRRETIAAIVNQGTGGWYLARRSEDEYRFSRDVGGGYWADYQLHRNDKGTAVQPDPSLSIRDVAVGKPMVAVDENQAVYTGAWTRTSTFGDGSRPRKGVSLFPDATRTATTTAGSNNITVSPAISGVAAAYSGRAIHIPGAGAGGVDYYGTMVDAGSGVVSPAPATSVAGAPIYFYGRRRLASSAGQVATYTTPAASTRVGIIHGRNGSGGIHTVAINGDLTRATDLPTAQTLVDRGTAPASILTTNGGTIAPTTRVLDVYDPLEQYAAWRSLAHDLTPGAHVVTLTTTAHRANGSVGSTIWIAGWGHGTEATTLDTAGSYIFATTPVGKPMPTNDYALQVAPTSGGAATFLGGTGHGYEKELAAPSVAIDGSTAPLADGARVKVAHAASLTKSSHLFHPGDTANPVAKVTSVYTLTAQGMVTNNVVDWLRAATIGTAYLAMWTPTTSLSNFQLTGSHVAYDLFDLADDEFAGIGRSTAAVWWGDAGAPVVTAVLVPSAEKIVGGWGVNGYTSVRRVGASTKFYPRRSGAVSPGDRWASDAVYMIARLPAGGSYYFPLT